MYENVRKISYDDNASPLEVRYVGESLCDEKFYIERSCSDVTAMEYIVDGEGTLEINGQLLHPKKNDLFLLTEGSNHKYYSQKENGWHKYFIGFHGAAADFMIREYLPTNTYLFENCHLETQFRRIFDIAFNNSDVQKANSLLAVEVFKLFNNIRDVRIADTEDFAHRIKRSIESCINGEFSLDDLSARLNYSKNHIIRSFADEFGKTPYRYYIECKTEAARDYLSGTALTIGEIAAILAYSDPQYFSYSFKKETGWSPREYRLRTKSY